MVTDAQNADDLFAVSHRGGNPKLVEVIRESLVHSRDVNGCSAFRFRQTERTLIVVSTPQIFSFRLRRRRRPPRHDFAVEVIANEPALKRGFAVQIDTAVPCFLDERLQAREVSLRQKFADLWVPSRGTDCPAQLGQSKVHSLRLLLSER